MTHILMDLKRTSWLSVGAVALSLGLASCGGSQSSSPLPVTPPTPSNAAPVFSSPASADVVENSDVIALTLAATDADNDTVTFALEGSDAAAFTVDSATGEVRFAASPDFETPTDADTNNAYVVTAVASDGNGGATRQDITITVTDLEPLPFFAEAVTGFDFPVYAEELPGKGGQLLVLEKSGRARLADPDTGTIAATDFLDVGATINANGEGGLLGFAVAPDFDTSGHIYVHVNNLSGATEIRRYTLSAGATDRADPTTERIIIQVDQPQRNHNAGSIGFDANGFLVIPMGDGGGAGDPNGFAQNTQSLLGKVLRLDVNGDDYPADANRNYAIPAGNTFTVATDGRPEIFAVGLRNPFRTSFDPATGDLLIADVGQNEREEINRLPMDDSSINFGWNIREGSLEFTGPDAPTLTGPVAEYEHGNGPTQGNSITGGVVFDGASAVFDNAYVFADFSSDNMWTIPADSADVTNPIFGDGFAYVNDQLLIGSERPAGVAAFSVSSENELFVTSLGGALGAGTIYRLEERE